jgi:ribonuclease P protein component
VAAEKAETRADAWIPYPERLAHRSPGACTPPPQGPRAHLGLIMTTSHRLSSADFRTIRPRQRVNGIFFALSIAPHPRGLKWACVVSKKVSVKAVTRNLVKRRCRSALSSELKTFNEPLALVFHAKRGAVGATFAEIEKDVRALIRRATIRGT